MEARGIGHKLNNIHLGFQAHDVAKTILIDHTRIDKIFIVFELPFIIGLVVFSPLDFKHHKDVRFHIIDIVNFNIFIYITIVHTCNVPF